MYRVGIITASDKGYAGQREDKSGSAIAEIMKENGYKIEFYKVLPDEHEILRDEMKELCDKNTVDLIITTGGTGFSKRDCTPEATLEIGERIVPGIAEAIRAYSMQITKRAMLGRGVSVIRKNTLIVNLPGSEKAVRESLNYIVSELEHGIKILKGDEAECGR
ncbi:MogA/MoaB family molybdenum cofactor biosynthesis protein [Clostridium sp.]|uniref:MogA/MoaB family molybdenum cofactor biosynthesis protein n=1 Tax=Clostridium sp. TaxID=1506 RepID=UPI002639FF41|nr:MogA/MoaB family molybdenum cofactor biosynthesis protein [Clostridium sp.]